MKTILDKVIENRNGHYVHALEVEDTYEIETVVDHIVNEFRDYGIQAIKDFFRTMTIYYIGNDKEMGDQVYEFDIEDYIDEHISL